ncbi:hypothetical protein BDR04DRAFT_1234896 [Suillus decipiens]|nr:hypothetical protein BDR04DRAFT_1234896 [Suillus decipiens]
MHLANLVQIIWSPTSLLLLTILGQTVIMGLAWGFVAEILLMEFLPLPDHIVDLIVEYQTILTLIVTLISTILSIITSMFFAYAIKKALRHHLSGPTTLFKIRTAMALSRLTWVMRWRSFKLSALTLAVFVIVTFLHTSWSTLLLPTLIQWPVPVTGTELDLGSNAFQQRLSGDLNSSQLNASQVAGYQMVNFFTLLSGLIAMYTQGGPDVQLNNMFNFNGVLYNQSTGGVLPAIQEYSGSSDPPSAVGLAFSGGEVPVNTNPDWGYFERDTGTHNGTMKSYTITQQGVTANVTCQLMDPSQNSFYLSNTTVLAASDITVQASPIVITVWNATANCSGSTRSLTYVTSNNSIISITGTSQNYGYTEGNAGPAIASSPQVISGDSTNYGDSTNPAIEGFLPIVVCPDPASISSTTPAIFQNKFDVFVAGEYKYNFLPTTICEVVPYLTTVNVTYSGGIISVDPIGTSPGSTNSSNLALLRYIASVVDFQAQSSQAMTNNPIGEFLTAYGKNDTSVMYNELENYWRGITEFASTQLRSGYSTPRVPSNMTKPINGTMYFTTYGWRSDSLTYIIVLVVTTLIWGVTVLAAGYSLIREKIKPSHPSFDYSDPVDLVMAASDGRLESGLCKGDRDKVEDIIVRFEDVPDDVGRIIRKRLVTVESEPLLKTALLESELYEE